MHVNPISFSYFFVLIRLRNARKKNETNSQVNDIDMYDLPTAKPGKNNFKCYVIQGLTQFFSCINVTPYTINNTL